MNYWKLKQIKRCVAMGGIIAYPTEAVYGLGCDPLNPQAVMKLLQIKQRQIEKGLILIASDQAQLAPFILPPTPDIQARLDASWPGPVTWLLEPRDQVPIWLIGDHTHIAVRVSAHPLVRQICDVLGHALVSTSSNISQRAPARNALSTRRIFGDQIDMIIAGPTGSQQNPTEIRHSATLDTVRHA
jgi:L-threonylcarbamoyladenylate synthase